MAFSYDVYKTQRICPVRFVRHVDGKPVLKYPDIDNRGYFRGNVNGTGIDRGPVVGVTEGDEIQVMMLRERISTQAALFATSSDKSVMTVETKGELPKSGAANLKIYGLQGADSAIPKGAKLEIRYGSETGVIIGELSVWVFKPLTVFLAPYRMTIHAADGTGIQTSIDVKAVIEMAKAIWRPLGINIVAASPQDEAIFLSTAGVLTWTAEFETLLQKIWAKDMINAYFVYQIDNPGFPGTLGIGLSRDWINKQTGSNKITRPGIFLCDTNKSGLARQSDIHWLANDLAHEVGHFFGLPHIDLRDSNNPRDDTWARRLLMHPSNTRGSSGDWTNNVGYGTGYRGALVSMKDLYDSNAATNNHISDPEYFTARTTIKRSEGPY